MTMSLLRFSFDFTKFERYKETGRYSFPFTIDLRPFCEQVQQYSQTCMFFFSFKKYLCDAYLFTGRWRGLGFHV